MQLRGLMLRFHAPQTSRPKRNRTKCYTPFAIIQWKSLDAAKKPGAYFNGRGQSRDRVWKPGIQAHNRATTRFFFVRSMASLNGRAVWGAARLAGSCIRSSNPHGSAHPVWKWGAENTTAIQEQQP